MDWKSRITMGRGQMLVMCVCLLIAPLTAPLAFGDPDSGPWWDVQPEPENPSPYYDSILYSEIAPKLREIELNSNRVKVDVIGQSRDGRGCLGRWTGGWG